MFNTKYGCRNHLQQMHITFIRNTSVTNYATNCRKGNYILNAFSITYFLSQMSTYMKKKEKKYTVEPALLGHRYIYISTCVFISQTPLHCKPPFICGHFPCNSMWPDSKTSSTVLVAKILKQIFKKMYFYTDTNRSMGTNLPRSVLELRFRTSTL